MNSYTFVPKLQHLTSNNPSSSLMQRLQELKASMHHANPSEQQYSSVPPNANQYGSAFQNQRLFHYLPKETEQRLSSKHNEGGAEEYESYRKSLQKKLNYLFEKQKHIMKKQSIFQQLKTKQEVQQRYVSKDESDKRQYTEELERKYSQLKQQQKSLDSKQSQQPLASSPQPLENRQYKVHSTIQSNYWPRISHYGQRDEQVDRMQRKIRILEMKYLGSYSQPGLSPSQCEVENCREKKIALSGISEMVPKNNSKSCKFKHKKEKTSPDRLRAKLNSSQNQTIYHQNKQERPTKQAKHDCKQTQSPKQKKHPIKDYMNTIQYPPASLKKHQIAQSLLHAQFNELKRQFHTLLQISKSMIEKVETSEEQKIAKKERKLRAKAMLREILLRLDEIKWEIHGQAASGQKNIKINHRPQKTKATSDQEPRFQKSSNKALDKKKVNKNYSNIQKDNFLAQKKFNLQNEGEQNLKKDPQNLDEIGKIERLKKLLILQVEHRQLVQRKLEAVYGNEILVQHN